MNTHISTAELARETENSKVHYQLADKTSCGITIKDNWEKGVETPPNPETRPKDWCRKCFVEDFILVRGAKIRFP